MRNNRQVMSPNRVSSQLQDSRGEDAQNGTKNRRDDSSEDEDRSSDSSPSSPAPSATSRSDGASSSSSSSDCSVSDSSSSNSDSDSASSDEGKCSKRKRSSKKKRPLKKKKRSRSSLLDSPSLEVPKLTGADDYELWRTMVALKLKVQKLWSLVTEEVVLDSPCSSAKKPKLLSLGRLPPDWLVVTGDCCAAKNDILIKAAMFVRKLAKGERVDTYIDAIMQLQEDLLTLGRPLDDAELARPLLTNALEVFPNLSTELVGARMKARELEVGKVRGRLLAREQEENMRAPAGGIVVRNASSDSGSRRSSLTQIQYTSFLLGTATAARISIAMEGVIGRLGTERVRADATL
ncbi:hypothetical protein PF005_g25571 [Phytophthora fragariae]|nr:hypothetical protein PF011_g27118 [Phytophthora fragariae]KAE9060490.1 hypothetical protein PF010_g30197 [Phytophthora fragariae]KAE9175064.1 hypothetical protein PF005_g25571 [Phytophthora fragariae]KAE9180149.1 hypothetical protein PF002_g27643 [Phytophthora fragariae]